MSTSVACESQRAASAADVYVFEPIGVKVSQSSEFNLMEMMEVEYLQHIIQSHIDAQVTETDSSGLSHLEENLHDDRDGRISCSPHTPLACEPDVTSEESSNTGPVDIQEIKMLLLNESNSAPGCETTPASSAEVPSDVVCVVEERTDERRQRATRPLEGRPSPPARVCLEKRFLSVLCHSTNTSGIPAHAQIEKWSKPDKISKKQGTYPYEGRLFKTQSELIIPTELTVTFRADKGSESVMRAPLVIYTDTADQQTAASLKNEVVDKSVHPIRCVQTRPLRSSNITQGSENRKPCAGTSSTKRGRTRPLVDRTRRKEEHNRKERDRRRRIRLCCDELNLLVPFCYADTDKATTLQWTTAFLKYIQEIHGDRLKQDFQSAFCGKTGLRLKPSCVSVTLIDKA
ncbi:uncharacterized protein LOC127162204 isoform X2 [Labeo rohita]|uniref:uncharacterized protein LOC127162204 isoform X2 n=1 Tax=Labeo rohita TaxID=84645 RepID=UPI0021E29868|nr:uncharacterized protein LOC127162204 isoform X2 [Labeo rohita]